MNKPTAYSGNTPVTYSESSTILVKEMNKILGPHRSGSAYKEVMRQLSGKAALKSSSAKKRKR
jgi:hypothetical protein